MKENFISLFFLKKMFTVQVPRHFRLDKRTNVRYNIGNFNRRIKKKAGDSMLKVNYCVCCGHKLDYEVPKGKSESGCPNCNVQFDIYCSVSDIDIIAYYPDDSEDIEDKDIVG